LKEDEDEMVPLPFKYRSHQNRTNFLNFKKRGRKKERRKEGRRRNGI
jgi:hypothetical protein